MENDETPNNNKKTISLDFQDDIIEVKDINDDSNDETQKKNGENINALASKINISNLTESKNKNENSIIDLNEINPVDNVLQNNGEVKYNFTDFSEIDFFEFFKNQDKFKEKKSIKKEDEKNNSNNIINLNENKSLEDGEDEELQKKRKALIRFLVKNKVRKLNSNSDFNIGNLVYKHKDEIFKGNIINIPIPKKKRKDSDFRNINENQLKNVFIKKVLIEKIYQIKLISNETQIYFKLLKYLKDNFYSEVFFNLNFYYYDKTEKYLYLFYSYPEGIMTVQEKIIDIEKIKMSEDQKEMHKDKLLLAFKFIKFIILLHSNMILHRDLSISYFYFLPNQYDKNEIQSGTLKTFDLYNCVQIPPKNELSKYQSLDEYINKNYLFITPKYVAPELTTIRPLYGWGQDIWSFACVLLTIFIKYTDLNEDLI